jgi:hypothetical protein
VAPGGLVAGARGGVVLSLSVGVGVEEGEDPAAGDSGGDGPVAGDLRRFVAAAEQGLVSVMMSWTSTGCSALLTPVTRCTRVSAIT